MAIKFTTPKTALNTTTRAGQNTEGNSATLTELTATENGVYTPEEGYDGYSKVTVEVSDEALYNEGKEDGIEEQKAKLTSLEVTANGQYDREDGYNSVNVNVPIPTFSTQEKSITVTENGVTAVTPDANYDGLSSVSVTTNINTDKYYNEGYRAGTEQQKAKLTHLDITANGDYSREDGYSDVSVNVPIPTFSTQEKTVTITENGVTAVTPDANYDGLSSVEITTNIDTSAYYDEGHSAGVAEQKAKLTSTTFTENGVFTREDGWNQVEVDIEPRLQSKTVIPNTIPIEVTADDDYDGLNKVTVNSVTAGIDDNIQPENIIEGVSILGVSGTNAGYQAGWDEGYAQGQSECPTFETAALQETITENGTYNFDPSDYQGSQYDGFDSASITVAVPEPSSIDLKETITANGTYEFDPTQSDADFYGSASITVNVPTSVTTLQAKTADPSTAQQIITPDQGYDALSQVTIAGVTASIDANIQPENILSGVTILGVEGTDEGYTAGYDAGYAQGQAECGGGDDPHTGYVEETITENGTYTYTPSDYQGEQFDYFDGVSITVNVPSSGGGCVDWESMGWTCEDVASVGINSDVAITANLLENYTPEDDSTYWSYKPAMVYAPKVDITETINSSVGFFQGCVNLVYAPDLQFRTINPSSEATSYSLFGGCISLRRASVDLANASGGGDVGSAYQMFYGCKNLKNVTLTNTDSLQNCMQMFQNCSTLQTAPTFNTANVTDFRDMFKGCALLSTVPAYNTSKATTMTSMFQSCVNLTAIPQFDYSNVEGMDYMFYDCTGITSLPAFNSPNAFDITSMFGSNNSNASFSYTSIGAMDCTSVAKANPFGASRNQKYNSLTTLGGFTNLGKAFVGSGGVDHRLILTKLTALTKESIMNVINGLAAPDDTTVTDAQLYLNATSYALLSEEEIAIATAKRWTIMTA